MERGLFSRATSRKEGGTRGLRAEKEKAEKAGGGSSSLIKVGAGGSKWKAGDGMS